MAGHIKIVNPKERKRLRRKSAIRKRVHGTADKPRLSVFRSARHIYVQAIDDVANRVLAASSDMSKDIDTDGKKKKEKARAVGMAVGKKLLDLKIDRVVFDRNGYIFHGRIKELAEGAREAGLKF
ncbi:MAG: 50S ribosomal protein L18 [Myxococcota bacterium]